MPGAERSAFMVRQSRLLAISLVRGSDDYIRIGSAPACSFEHRPGAFDVGFKRGEGAALGGADDGLRGQMQNRLNLVFGKGAFEEFTITDGAVDQVDLIDQAA